MPSLPPLIAKKNGPMPRIAAFWPGRTSTRMIDVQLFLGKPNFGVRRDSSGFQEPSLMTMEPAVESLLAKYPVAIALPVLWGDQDAFGHVNNNAYFRWFEIRREPLDIEFSDRG